MVMSCFITLEAPYNHVSSSNKKQKYITIYDLFNRIIAVKNLLKYKLDLESDKQYYFSSLVYFFKWVLFFTNLIYFLNYFLNLYQLYDGYNDLQKLKFQNFKLSFMKNLKH